MRQTPANGTEFSGRKFRKTGIGFLLSGGLSHLAGACLIYRGLRLFPLGSGFLQRPRMDAEGEGGERGMVRREVGEGEGVERGGRKGRRSREGRRGAGAS